MIDLSKILTAIIDGLQECYPNYTFIRANQKGNRPLYPYVTINTTSPSISDMYSQQGNVSRQNVENDDTKVQLTYTKQPKTIFSINCLSNDQDQCYKILSDTIDWLNVLNQQYLKEHGIVVVKIDTIQDRTTFLETDFQYKIGFDLTIRTVDKVSVKVDSIDSVSL